MGKIFTLVEHRRGQIHDISFELLTKGRDLAAQLNSEVVALVLGHGAEEIVERVKGEAHQVLWVKGESLKEPNAEAYQIVLSHILKEYNPFLTLIGHTALGMDLSLIHISEPTRPY